MRPEVYYRICFVVVLSLIQAVASAKAQDIERLRKEYSQIRNELKAAQRGFRSQYENSLSDETRHSILRKARECIVEHLTEQIFPAWYGTRWDYNGTSRVPGVGNIACGTFVVYTLQDAGFKIPSRMSMQPSENIIRNLVGAADIKRFCNGTAIRTIKQWVESKGQGLFLVGLDQHVGFIIYTDNKLSFCHASYYDPPLRVVDQDISEESPFTNSRYRVMAKMLDDTMMEKWVYGKNFPLTYDYFEGH
jgi:hypothetical protein